MSQCESPGFEVYRGLGIEMEVRRLRPRDQNESLVVESLHENLGRCRLPWIYSPP